MFLCSPDVHQAVICVIGQEYGLHKIKVYKVLDFFHNEDFVSNDESSSCYLTVCVLLTLMQP